jgi:Na+/H+ antiporter NhaC
LGAFFLYDFNPIIAFARSLDTFMGEAIESYNNAAIILFIFIMGGGLGIVIRSGGIDDLTSRACKYAYTTQRAALLAMLIGTLLFFNTASSMLLLGISMRPIAEKLRMSPEKLSFISDSTASPIACLIPISSWIGYEIALISDQFLSLSIDDDPYFVLLRSLPYRFYPMVILWMVFVIIVMKRDFGPMYAFEVTSRYRGEPQPSQNLHTPHSPTPPLDDDFDAHMRQQLHEIDLSTDEFPHADIIDATATPIISQSLEAQMKEYVHPLLIPSPDKPKLWWNAAIPLLTLSVAIVVGLVVSGIHNIDSKLSSLNTQLHEAQNSGTPEMIQTIQDKISLLSGAHSIFSNASSVRALVWAAFLTSFVAAALMIGQRLLTLDETMAIWSVGTKSLLLAILILILAWSVGDVCKGIHTGDFIVYLFGGFTSRALLPTITFFLSSLISFATGTSWGTMAIVFPLAIPLTWSVAPGDRTSLLGVISSILSGSVFGDHCSPVSDTTILAATFCGCSVITHVKTQMPYAVVAAIVSVVFGDLPTGFGLYNEWVAMLLCLVVATLIVFCCGKRIPDYVSNDLTQQNSESAKNAANVNNDNHSDVSSFSSMTEIPLDTPAHTTHLATSQPTGQLEGTLDEEAFLMKCIKKLKN